MKAPHYFLSMVFMLNLSYSFATTISPDLHSNTERSSLFSPANGSTGSSCDTNIFVDLELCAGEIVQLSNQTIYSDGLYVDSLINLQGCDSLIHYNVVYKAHYLYYISDSICNGDSAFIGSQWRYTSGLYRDTLISISGCDSVLSVNLTYKDSTHINQVKYKCSGDSIYAGGFWQTQEGLYYDTSYSLTLCDSFVVTQIINYPNPVGLASASSTQICDGDSVFITESFSGTSIWNNGNTHDFWETPHQTTTYSVSIIDSNGCPSYSDVTVNVSPNPILTLATLNTICEGDSVQLLANSPDSITWSGGLSNGTFIKPSVSGTQYVSAINYSGCQSFDSIQITVNQKPTLNISQPANICQGQSMSIMATSNGTANWVGTNLNSIIVSPSQNTIYSAISVSTDGCITTDSVQITVFPNPTLLVSNDTSICEGSSINLEAISNGTLQWNMGTGSILNITPIISQSYVVTATNAQGCQSLDSVQVRVNDAPTLTIDSISNVCLGDSVLLNANSNGFVYWGFNIQNASYINPMHSQTYFVSAYNSSGCMVEDSISVIVNTLPYLNMNTVAPVCQGFDVVLNATSIFPVTWNVGVGNPVITTVFQDTMFTAITTDTNGCSASETVNVTVFQKPWIIINAEKSDACMGDTIEIEALGNGNIKWNNGLTGSILVSPLKTTTYTAIITNTDGCENTESVTLTMHQLPNVTIESFGVSNVDINKMPRIDLPNAFPVGGKYYGDGVVNEYFIPSVAGIGKHDIFYLATNDFGCSNDASTSITVTTISGVDENEVLGTILMYPNPVTETVKLDLNLGTNDFLRYSLIDISGKLILEGEINDSQVNELQLNNLSKGLYFVKVFHANKVTTLKLIKK